MAIHDPSNNLAEAIKAALGIKAKTRRLILDLPCDGVPVLYLEAWGIPLEGASGDLHGIDWAAGLQAARIEWPGSPISGEFLELEGAGGADLGRIEVRAGDLVVILWPSRLSENERARVENEMRSAIEDTIGECSLRVLILDGAEGFGFVALHGRPADAV